MPDIVVIQDPQTVISVTAGQSIDVASPGPQGPPGPQGLPGEAANHYTHTQVTPSTSWGVTHNLGFRPNVAVLLDSGQVITDGVVINHIDENSLTVLSGLAISGRAELS
jgi:hypothetical protein